jgi:monothiol glutaredoxin
MENIVFDRIRREINSHSVVLYMKGTAAFPMCGFSAAVVQILTQLGVPFRDINVLEDSVIRQGIKQFAAWPTIPQLYIKGAFIGGADIVREMYASGELQALLQKHRLLAGESETA